MSDNDFQYEVDGTLAEAGYLPDSTTSSLVREEVANQAPVRSPLKVHGDDSRSLAGDGSVDIAQSGVSQQVATLHRAVEQHNDAMQERVAAWDGRGYDPLFISAKDHISFYSHRKRVFKESDLAFECHLQDQPIHVLPL